MEYGIASIFVLICIVVVIFIIAGLWKVFQKADKPGWAAVVPIYNIILLLQIAEKPVWWILLYFLSIIPFVGFITVIVINILVGIGVAKNFGKSDGFGVGLGLLGFIFYPILGFGDAVYQPNQKNEIDDIGTSNE
jgi:uncharacterized membrane protein YhaH (DUF805 family)